MGITATGGSPCRILVVYDKQANAVAPTITDILLADDFHSQNNLSNRDRFVTLCDHITDPIGAQNVIFCADNIYKKLNLEVMFNQGSVGTVGDITSGSIYMFVAQAAGIATITPLLTFRSRIRFSDN